jgi:hypothetical protein
MANVSNPLHQHHFYTIYEDPLMRIYRTYAEPKTMQGISYQASQTEASKARGELKRLGHKPETQTIDIPTAKGLLIDWLNENACR